MLQLLLAPLHSREKQQLLDAIERIGPVITPESISIETGLPILAAIRQLNVVASETGAHLEVNSNGGISYRFAPNFANSYFYDLGKKLFYSNGSFIIRLAKVAFRVAVQVVIATVRIAAGILWFLLRISFCIFLVASLVFIVIAIIAAIFGDNGDGGVVSGDLGFGGDAGGGSFDLGSGGSAGGGSWFDLGSAFADLGNCFNFMPYSWDYNIYYYSDTSYGHRTTTSYDYHARASQDYALAAAAGTTSDTSYAAYCQQRHRSMPEPNLLLDCFSFLFGDGYPNADLEDKKWKYIGRVIQQNNGVVIAEQLAPYATTNATNEDWMLPILVHFNGIPEVSETGSIIYLFPSLANSQLGQLSNTGSNKSQDVDQLRQLYRSHLARQATGERRKANDAMPSYLKERRWSFSLANSESLIVIGVLASLNLSGSYWLFQASTTTKSLLSFHQIAGIMLAFATFFVVVPAVRWVVQSFLNSGIENRNCARQELAGAIARPDEETGSKLSEANTFRLALLDANRPEVLYTTEKDALEQEFETIYTPHAVRERSTPFQQFNQGGRI